MKIYEVHYDNGEEYEDHFDCAQCFYSTYEGAVRYLEEECGFVRHIGRGWIGNEFKEVPVWKQSENKYVCKEGYTECTEDCKKYDDWINAEEDDDDTPCDEYDSMTVIYYEYEEWTIIEHEVRQ